MYMQHDGRAVYVDGYCAVYNALSEPLRDHDGMREYILPGAFDSVLRPPGDWVTCQVHHLGPSSVLGAVFDGTLELWSDPIGLGFRVGPILATGQNTGVIKSIVRGEIRGCSWSAAPADVKIERIGGEHVRVIHKFRNLGHISACTHGAYLEAVCWGSHEAPFDLPDHLKPLAHHWQEHRPAPHTRTKPAIRQAPPARAVTSRPQARANAKRRAPPPLTVAEIYPAVLGFSSAEQDEAAFHEAAARRMTKEAQARTRARRRRPA